MKSPMQRQKPTQRITDQAFRRNGRALIIGSENQKVDLLKRYLAHYFSQIDLLADSGQLASLTDDSHLVIVVTDTLADVLNYDFFCNLRYNHPRARLLCLVDRVSRETEKALRAAGLLFLGSYDHFEVCHASILQAALSKGDPAKTRAGSRRCK